MMTQSGKKISSRLFFLVVFSLIFLICGASQASSFPFRAVAPGDTVPSLSFTGVADGATLTTDSLKGNGSAIVFWGADVETKKKRSIKTFKATEEVMSFLDERKVKVILVNAQGDAKDVIQGVMTESGVTIPSYMDDTQKAYGDLGIFVVPSLMLMDKDGKIVTGLGYSGDFTDRLKGEVQVMLGEKTREEMEKELRPEMKEKPVEQKEAERHLNMAIVMKKRGQIDSAINELNKAVKLEPDMVEAQGQLGCLYLDEGKIEEAKKALDKSYELDPDYLPANICDARVRAEEGEIEDALGDLKALLFRNSRNAELHYIVGTLLEKQEKFAEAAKEYRKAFELSSKHAEFN